MNKRMFLPSIVLMFSRRKNQRWGGNIHHQEQEEVDQNGNNVCNPQWHSLLACTREKCEYYKAETNSHSNAT